jgi:hypothetical protein
MLDPFDDPGETLQRDQWKRPIILRPWEPDGPCSASDGKRWNCHITKAHGHYTRASTFASSLDDGPGLGIWMKRHVGLALSWEPNFDIRAIIAGMDYDSGKELDARIEEALNRHASRPKTQSLRRANLGTAIHRFTEPDSPPDVPAELVTDVESFHRALPQLRCSACGHEGFEVVFTEMSVINDEWLCAGTFDHLIRCKSCEVVRVMDKKTGSDMHPLANSIQLVAYADGVPYDDSTGARLSWPFMVDRRRGYIAHIEFGTGRCDVWEFDLVAAYEVATLALTVRERRARQNDLCKLIGSY